MRAPANVTKTRGYIGIMAGSLKFFPDPMCRVLQPKV